MNRVYPRVLIVEDEETINHMLCRIFEIWKWEFRRAITCAQALSHLRGEERFDLLYLDLMLPDGDGTEILRWLKGADSVDHLTVVVSTAKPACVLSQVASLAPDLILQKPFIFEPLRMLASELADRFYAARSRAEPVAGPGPAPFVESAPGPKSKSQSK